MFKLNTAFIILVSGLILFILTPIALASLPEQPSIDIPELPSENSIPVPPLNQVTKILYQIELFNPVRHSISNPDSVAELVGLIQFEPKEACLCAHQEMLTLTYPEGQFTFSICSHCLDLRDSNRSNFRFKMPDGLWKHLQVIAQRNQ